MTEKDMLENLIAMQKPCTSSRGPGVSHWKKTDKLDEAKNRCGDYFYYENGCSLVFSKIPVEDLANHNHIILISSHADFVPEIKKPYCKEVGDFFLGTFDNSITNATLLNFMQENLLPDNIVFTLTGDEETGRCYGARETLMFLNSKGINLENVYPIALDVTHEGYDRKAQDSERRLTPICYSIENITSSDTAIIDIAEDMSDYPYVCSPRGYFPPNLPLRRRAKNFAWLDEGVIYRNLIGHGFSFCIPTGGSMHSQAGLYVNKGVYYNYNEALKQFTLHYSRYLHEEESLRSTLILTP